MKKTLTRLLILLVVMTIEIGIIYTLMRLCGVDTIEGLQEIVTTYGLWSYLIIIVLQIIQVIFIPISNQLITIPAIAVVGVWPAFFCSWIGIEIGTVILYLLGRYTGGKMLEWLLNDKQKVEQIQTFINTKRLFYPIGMLIGVIPDDILTTLAGIAQFNFWYVLIVSIVTRGICTLTTVFGFGILTQTWWGIVLLVVGIIGVTVIGYLYIK